MLVARAQHKRRQQTQRNWVGERTWWQQRQGQKAVQVGLWLQVRAMCALIAGRLGNSTFSSARQLPAAQRGYHAPLQIALCAVPSSVRLSVQNLPCPLYPATPVRLSVTNRTKMSTATSTGENENSERQQNSRAVQQRVEKGTLGEIQQ